MDRTTALRRPLALLPRETLLTICGGIFIGYFVLYVFAGYSTNWATYVIVAAALASVFPIIVRMSGGAERFFLFLFVFALQAQLGFNPVYWQYATYKSAGPTGLYISLILLTAVALGGVWLVERISGRGRALVLPPSFLRPATFLIFASVLSMVHTSDKSLTIFGIFELVSLAFVAIVACHFSSTVEGLVTIRNFFLVTILAQSLVIVFQNVTGIEFGLQYGVTAQGAWDSSRFSGTLVRPSVSGTFMVLGLLFALGQLFGRKPARHRWWVWLVLGLALVDLLLSQTRSAYIGFAIAGSGLGWHLYRRGTLRGKVVLQIVASALVALLLAAPALVKRLGAPHSDDAMVRWNLVVIASKMIRENPVLGMGLNTATNHIQQFATGNEGWIFIVHNEYLLIAVEMGFIGLAAFLWLMLDGFRTAVSGIEAENAVIADTAAIVFWCLIALGWAMMLDHISSTMTHVYLWFLFGMAQGLAVVRRRSESAPA